MPNYSLCSDGTKVSQATINAKRSESYRKHDDGTNWCRGCGGQATCHAHIIAQARAKVIHKTELIWDHRNWFKSCYKCNSDFESFKGEACKKLFNYETNLEFLRLHDYETYLKYTNL